MIPETRSMNNRLNRHVRPGFVGRILGPVIVELIGAPWVVFPFLIGFTGLMLNWALAPSTFGGVFSYAGYGGLAVSFVTLVMQVLHRGGSLVEQQKLAKQQAELNSLQRELDVLDDRLVRDEDVRTQQCLRDIRQLYTNLRPSTNDAEGDTEGHVGLAEIEKLFRACVKQLSHTYDLWNAAQTMKGESRREAERDRERLLGEVFAAAEQLGAVVKQFHLRKGSENREELSRLTDQLNRQMENMSR